MVLDVRKSSILHVEPFNNTKTCKRQFGFGKNEQINGTVKTREGLKRKHFRATTEFDT